MNDEKLSVMLKEKGVRKTIWLMMVIFFLLMFSLLVFGQTGLDVTYQDTTKSICEREGHKLLPDWYYEKKDTVLVQVYWCINCKKEIRDTSYRRQSHK